MFQEWRINWRGIKSSGAMDAVAGGLVRGTRGLSEVHYVVGSPHSYQTENVWEVRLEKVFRNTLS